MKKLGEFIVGEPVRTEFNGTLEVRGDNGKLRINIGEEVVVIKENMSVSGEFESYDTNDDSMIIDGEAIPLTNMTFVIGHLN